MKYPDGSPKWEWTSVGITPIRHAICLTCGWSTEPWTGTRERAIEHVTDSGHTVEWHSGEQENITALAAFPGQLPAPVDSWEDPPQPTDTGSLAFYIGRTWPQRSFAEGIDQLSRLAYCEDPGLLAMADQAAAYVRDRAKARDVRVGGRWITRRNWLQLTVLAYSAAAALAAGVAVLLGHVLALGSYPTTP